MLSVEIILQILYNLDAWNLCQYRTVSQSFNQLCIKALMYKICHEGWAIELRTPSSAYAQYFNPDYISPQVGRLICVGYELKDGCLHFRSDTPNDIGYTHKPIAHELQLHCKEWPSPVINLPRRALKIEVSPFNQSANSNELSFTYSVSYRRQVEYCEGCHQSHYGEREIAVVQPQMLKVALSWILQGIVVDKSSESCSEADLYILSK
ncbi:hypothetical protein K450DRAFT_216965 [Umbelopsis ramanniana AG]|uniref:F-box domain-containing protein n=1 Tax=Umbelopsis ramanniana AG TaxID=1314678 RepID=A0AAD5EJG7_UMBRA|nr:uncharacterized protein K450DRAFT_216965 [Umbelopsis ramanniana AG]KAI8584572.1 hypothetical protein K450DRAFT_216965 [Umbelopsis ramanniana AG]